MNTLYTLFVASSLAIGPVQKIDSVNLGLVECEALAKAALEIYEGARCSPTSLVPLDFPGSYILPSGARAVPDIGRPGYLMVGSPTEHDRKVLAVITGELPPFF